MSVGNLPLCRKKALSQNIIQSWRAGLINCFTIKPDQAGRSMDFSIVILSKHVSTYPDIAWSDWKDENRKKMKSEGDNWSAATLTGANIWDCLDSNKIDRMHLVQWKKSDDDLHSVSLPDHPHPSDQPSN